MKSKPSPAPPIAAAPPTSILKKRLFPSYYSVMICNPVCWLFSSSNSPVCCLVVCGVLSFPFFLFLRSAECVVSVSITSHTLGPWCLRDWITRVQWIRDLQICKSGSQGFCKFLDIFQPKKSQRTDLIWIKSIADSVTAKYLYINFAALAQSLLLVPTNPRSPYQE